MDYLPNIRYHNAVQGVIFIIFGTGDSYFYPLTDKSANHEDLASAKLLTLETPSAKKFDGGRAGGAANRHYAFDVPLTLAPEHRVFTFSFAHTDNQTILPPRKVLLSPNKKFLLLLGAMHRGNSCLLVYQISEESAPWFRLVFYDLSFTFLDACFSPDSTSLVVIPFKYPYIIFILNLIPLAYQRHDYLPEDTSTSSTTGSFSFSSPAGSAANTLRDSGSALPRYNCISFEPRALGPLAVIGPARGLFGQTMVMTHIASNTLYAPHSYHFITWNDEPYGEYCLWTIEETEESRGMVQFKYYPRLLLPVATPGPSGWLEPPDENAPKTHILDAQFSPDPTAGPQVFFLVTRTNSDRKSDTGIGLQMLWLDPPPQVPEPQHGRGIGSAPRGAAAVVSAPAAESDGGPASSTAATTPAAAWAATIRGELYWYQITDSTTESEILCARWTPTFLLGTRPAAAALVRGKGLYELVDTRYCSQFQALHEPFTNGACQFVQMGKFHRFWLNCAGELSVIVVTPSISAPHPEWSEIFRLDRTDIMAYRVLGRRIGYFINELEPDPQVEALVKRTMRKHHAGKSGGGGPKGRAGPGKGSMEIFWGLHLYRCWRCKRTLLKPLECAQCMSVVYCSKICQIEDWPDHKSICLQVKEKKPQRRNKP